MEQNLTNEIVSLLLTDDLHTRAIAGHPASNPAMVLRKLRDLSEDNDDELIPFFKSGRDIQVHIENPVSWLQEDTK